MTCARCLGPIHVSKGYNEHPDGALTCDVCRDADDVALFVNTGTLTTPLMIRAMLDHHDKKRTYGCGYDEPYPLHVKLEWFDHFCAATQRVHGAMKLWEREVWFGGHHPERDEGYTRATNFDFREYINKKRPPGSLQGVVEATNSQGLRADVGAVTYLSCTLAGRSMFQIEQGEVRVTLILDESSPNARGGVQGLDATADQAVALIAQGIADWKAGKIKLQPSRSVGL